MNQDLVKFMQQLGLMNQANTYEAVIDSKVDKNDPSIIGKVEEDRKNLGMHTKEKLKCNEYGALISSQENLN
ncbi:14204_t:CDS:2 [Funneliformis caledonium]|uniref:14204_t:CDS:1 n=1 Tax=Funneliformis caledonium TaxID=1117310 RepID=A0A9N9IUZ3_9GLOM|nr:14204_t:CDS:2 [Funneliformis caledonium]